MNIQYLKTTLQHAEPQLRVVNQLIDSMSHFYIFPFEIQGCVNVTETGIKPESLSVSDVTYFSKVVAGDHPIVATWENSTRWIGKPKRYSFMQCELGAKKHYGVGRYFKGMVTRDAQGLSISNNSSWSGASMAHLQEQTSISITTTTKILKENIRINSSVTPNNGEEEGTSKKSGSSNKVEYSKRAAKGDK